MLHRSMQTTWTASRQAGVAPASQYAASSAVRSSTCPGRPCNEGVCLHPQSQGRAGQGDSGDRQDRPPGAWGKGGHERHGGHAGHAEGQAEAPPPGDRGPASRRHGEPAGEHELPDGSSAAAATRWPPDGSLLRG